MTRRLRGLRAVACGAGVMGLLVAVAPATVAQTGATGDAPRGSCFAGSLPPTHWAGAALSRLHALGAADGFLSAQGAIPVCEAYARFLAASEAGERDWLRRLAGSWRERLEGEFRGVASVAGGGVDSPILLGAAGGVTLEHRHGAAAPGGGGLFPPERTGALPLPDAGAARLGLEADLLPWRRVVVSLAPTIGTGGAALARGEVAAAAGPIAVSIGRSAAAYGGGVSGGVVLGPTVLDRVQIETHRPIVPRGVLSPMGRIAFHSLLSRFSDPRHVGDPYFWAASFSVQPHRRATVSVHRAAMFPDDYGTVPVTAGNLLNMMIGRVAGGAFEDQVVSVEGRFHLPTEGVVPLTAYMEWGAEDAAGAWWNVPGRVVGVLVPSVPGAPTLALGVERTAFGETCCWNPMWYRHGAFRGGWALDDRTLGHPLGGNGVEWLLYGDLDTALPALSARARVFRRDRGPDNLFVPGRDGSSWGTDSSLRWQESSGFEIFGAVSFESGSRWSECRLSAGARLFLR